MNNIPTDCCKVVGYQPKLQYCHRPAQYWYDHNGDICSYCEDHNYQCGPRCCEICLSSDNNRDIDDWYVLDKPVNDFTFVKKHGLSLPEFKNSFSTKYHACYACVTRMVNKNDI